MKILVIVEKTATGYFAYVSGLSIFTTGETRQVLVTNILEAIHLYGLDDVEEKGMRFQMKMTVEEFKNFAPL
jgi:predicted RNase H-like HicB family nuclease